MDFRLLLDEALLVVRDPGVRTGALVSIAAVIVASVGSDSLTAAAGAASQRLPKVRVAKDGRTFITENRTPFVPFGVTYYRPGTGWAPQVWKQFDPEATHRDFARIKEFGVNCVRVFLTYGSFYTEPGVLRPEGLAKFDQFLVLAEEAGLYVHPTGPDHWEGPPNWKPYSVADDGTLRAREAFWKLFAARYRGRNVIFAYDLLNEPSVEWQNESLKPRWNDWLKQRYSTAEKLNSAWSTTNAIEFGNVSLPVAKDSLKNRELLDFQSFREDIADEWTQRQAAAIKTADPGALVTVGFLQTSVPSLFWGGVGDYTGFRPARQAKFLDFLEIHFYPLARGAYEYKTPEDEQLNLAYLESIVRETARPGKPVVLAEFGWYGGNQKPKFDRGAHPQASEEQQAQYCRRAIEASAGFVVGWLNWGFYDHPEATDCSELTGLLTADGKAKAWGKTFQELSKRLSGKVVPPRKTEARPELDWEACLTSAAAAKEFHEAYFHAFMADGRAKSAK